jgi:hypothetical protein
MPGQPAETPLLRGRLTTFRRRCGKPGFRCATGEPHESAALRYTENGRSKLVTLSEADVAEVAAALTRYQQARAELDEAAQAGLATLTARLGGRRTGGRR